MSLPAGTRVGRYEILALLGAGGMGQVYKATDLKLERSVALKFLPTHLSGGTQKDRFMQEARAASALDHPNIGTVHSIEETDDGQLYIVMACYDGETLQDKIRRGPLPALQALDIAMQTASGLAEAHAKGIVHRDIKPSNIMVTRQGVKLLDFGLAKFAGSDDLTQTGTTVGTAVYMSPEQALGRAADQRSDIWSLGVVLYEMLTGRLPFQGDNVPARLLSITTDPPAPMEKVAPELEAVVYRCLAKDPEQRYRTTKELLDDLSRLRISGDTPTQTLVVDTSEIRRRALEAASTHPSGLRTSSRRAAGASRRWRMGAAATAAVLVVVAAVWFLAPWRRAGPPVSREKHVVVLPFNNIGNDPANGAICDGLMETLTSRLTSLEQPGGPLWVVPASEVRRRRIADASEAQHALGANLVVTGSVQRDTSGVRLTVNLVDTRTLPPRQVGSAVVDDRLGNFSTLQDNVVATLAKLLNVELSPRALGSANGESTAAPAAYESYLKGLSNLQRYDKPGNLDAAIKLFESSVKDDPRFALAYARLGEALWTKHRVSPDPQLIEQALANCKRAEEINNQLAPVHVTLARIHAGTGKYDLAIQEFQRALELDPHSAEAYQQMARAYESMGRIAEAEANLKKAVALRPDNWDGYNSLGAFYIRQSRYPEAAAAFRHVLDLTPDNAAAYSNLGVVLNRMQDPAGARRMYEKSIALNPSYSVYTNLANIYYGEGNFAQAADAYEKALKLNDRDHRPWGGLASAYAAAGMADKSHAAFQRAKTIAEGEAAKNPDNSETQALLAFYYARLGMRDKALSRIESALVLAPEDRDTLYRATLVYEALGDRPAALKHLRDALAHGYSKEKAQRDPDLRKLRDDPAFQSLDR